MSKKRCCALTIWAALLASCPTLAQQTDPTKAPPTIPPEIAAQIAQAQANAGEEKEKEFPDFDQVAKDYEKVVSVAGGQSTLYTLWKREKDGQMLAELSRNFETQNIFIAYTIAGGVLTSGEQVGDVYAKWKRYDKRLALIQPNVTVRTSGDLESKKAHSRVFTDRVMLDVPILAMGPSGGPVIDLDGLLVGHSTEFFGYRTAGANSQLLKIAKAKAFPQNVEVAFEMPLRDGRFATLYYSISAIPATSGYKPRVSDSRIGYFTTAHMDLGDAGADQPWKRYANRWNLEKADPKLKMSPPKQPLVFYLEHTIPIRYRRWVRDGLLEWNKAFERVGLVNAIEVYQQDARSGAHMEKDPEDVRYNFLIWTNAITGYAIGPSRVDPRTGQILDGDISIPEQFITGWSDTWRKYMVDRAMENFGPDTLSWLQTRPQWDPRVRLATSSERPDVLRKLRMQAQTSTGGAFSSHPAAMADPLLMGDDRFDGLAGRTSQVNGACMNGFAKAMEISLFRMDPEFFIAMLQDQEEDEENEDEEGESSELDYDLLDGVPEWFIGPLLKDLIMHESGHILGLRHNFKASSAYSVAEINSDEDDHRPITGSVMDYTPTNLNFDEDKSQGEFAMVTIGEYDYWAIEYGYTFDDLAPVLARVSEPELAFATDDDTWGPDPLARTFDLGSDSLDFSESQMNLVHKMRGEILTRMVKDGDSWAKAREGYELMLAKHSSALSIATNWIGGSYIHRDKKGDPGDRDPIEPITAQQQRRALEFVIENAFQDDAYGLNASLLTKMTVDKWWDGGGFWMIFEDQTWPVHDRILGTQATVLTALFNPTTLNRVYDNEFRAEEDEDALTLPELMYQVTNAIWSELDDVPERNFTNRKPLISSLRRNLQREQLERLIDLSLPNPSLGAAAKPISNLAVHKLRELQRDIEKTTNRNASRLDTYSLAHLSEANVRIEKALDAQYIYNADDVGGSGGGMPFFFFNPAEASDGR